MGAASGRPQETGGVGIVDHGERTVFLSQLTNRRQLGDRSVHGEATIGRDETKACVLGLDQLCLEVGHVVVLVAEALRLAEPDAVDDRRVVEFVGNHGVFRAEKRFEQAAIGVESGGIKNRIFRSQKSRQLILEVFMNVLRATDEADRGHAEAMRIEGRLGGSDERGMVGESEIIVRAHVENAAPTGNSDLRILWTGDDAFRFVEPLRSDFSESVSEPLIEFREHDFRIRRSTANRQRESKRAVVAPLCRGVLGTATERRGYSAAI